MPSGTRVGCNTRRQCADPLRAGLPLGRLASFWQANGGLQVFGYPIGPHAIVAAVALTLRHRPNVRTQDPAKQAATRREDRIRLVDLPSSSDGSKQA